MPIKFVPKNLHGPYPGGDAAEAGKAAKLEAEAPEHEQLLQIKDFPQNYLLYHISKNNAGNRPPRHHNVVHLSDLDPSREWCPREPALLTKHNRNRPYDFVASATRTAFNMGHKGADLFIESLPDGMAWGLWKCTACKHTPKNPTRLPKSCENCGADKGALRYKEVFMRDPVTGIVASMDLFVDILGNGVMTGVEIKTEGNDSFKKRTKPEFEHEWRTMGYLWMMEASGLAKKHSINTTEARIVYITKEGHAPEPNIKKWGLSDWAKSSIKEYWVTRNDDMLENALARAAAYRGWRNAWDAGEEQPLPDRIPSCKKGNSRCQRCPVQKECWG